MRAPLFSIVTPVYNPPLPVLRDTINSVLAQTWHDWELILVDDASPDPQVLAAIRQAATRDPRIRVIARESNGHIVRASNDGIAAAQGQYIALLDHDDLLTPDALATVQKSIRNHPDADYFYSDEDKVDGDGNYYDAFRKPDWSPERLRGQNYASHLSVLRTSLVRDVGAFREGFDGSQDYDLILRVTERARQVVHIPEILYHWRAVPGSVAEDPDAKPYAWMAGRKAVEEHMNRLGIPSVVDFGRFAGTYRITRRLDPNVVVSVIIPTRGDAGLVWGFKRTFVVDAVRSLLTHAGHQNVEIVVVHDFSMSQRTIDQLREIAQSRLVLVPYDRRFNFAEKCNLGALEAVGEALVFLNDDVEIVSDDFITQLVAPLYEDGVGLTGARLTFSDSTIQHAGLVFYGSNLAHVFAHTPNESPGPFAALTINRECSGLTGACVAVRRSVFEQVGGMCEELPINFNDVDFSMKVRFCGYRLIWLADVRAYHFESQTRDPAVHEWESDFIWRRWVLPECDLYLPKE